MTAPDDLEKLKHHSSEWMSEWAQARIQGWNACIDHIHAKGLLLTPDRVAVPREATEAMQRAGAAKYWDQQRDEPGLIGLPQAAEIYKAMISAAKGE